MGCDIKVFIYSAKESTFVKSKSADWSCFPANLDLTLAMPTVVREFYRRRGEHYADVCAIERPVLKAVQS